MMLLGAAALAVLVLAGLLVRGMNHLNHLQGPVLEEAVTDLRMAYTKVAEMKASQLQIAKGGDVGSQSGVEPSDIQKAEKASGLKVNNSAPFTRPVPGDAGGQIEERALRLNFTGSLEQAMRFIYHIESARPGVTAREASFTKRSRQGDGTWGGSVTFVTYAKKEGS